MALKKEIEKEKEKKKVKRKKEAVERCYIMCSPTYRTLGSSIYQTPGRGKKMKDLQRYEHNGIIVENKYKQNQSPIIF